MTTSTATTPTPFARAVFAAAVLVCASYLAAPWFAPIEAASGAGAAAVIAWKASGIVLLALFALFARAPVLAAALGLSAVGDVLLDLGPGLMTAGIGAFAAAHLVYVGLLASRIAASGWRRAAVPGVALVVVFAAGMLVWLGPAMGQLRLPASFYIGVIALMASLALLARAPMIVALGAILFLASDSLLALGLFKDGAGLDAGLRHLLVWGTYAGAQACLARGLALRPVGSDASP